MRKNLMRIACLVVAFALLSVPTFAALTGRYADGTFTVEGGATNLQTSLIIVEGAHESLPVANETVTGAVYIDQLAAAANGAAFEGVSLPGEVYTAFFSNESENSASSTKIVNATLSIAADNYTVEEGQTVLISASRPVAAFTVNGEAAELVAENAGYAFVPETAGTYTIVGTTTVAGQTITSNPITITATAAEEVLEPEIISGAEDVILESITNEVEDFAALPIGIKVNFGEGDKTINKMKWVFESGATYYYSENIPVNVTVSGNATFAAVVENGTVVDGVITDFIDVTRVGAIFDVNGQDYYTNAEYGEHKNAE